ncbi:unnamed protein product, partial [Sphacelaria rigidula]
MFFRMDKASLRLGVPECVDDTCNCIEDTVNVTVVNPPFLKLMNKYKPTGLISILSREVFSEIKEGMTIGFVRATKAYLLPTVVQDVFRFRKAYLTTAGVLRSLFDAISTANGTATAVSTLRGNYEDAIVSCGGFQLSDYESVCPWGILSFVESAASTLGATGNITEAEAEYLLGLRSPTTGSIFNETSGMLSWIAAGRYGGYLPVSSMPHPNETDPTGEEAYTALVATVCTWEEAAGGTAPSTVDCQAKVSGILEWVYGVWYAEQNELDTMVVDEWRGTYGDGSDIVCDTAGGICPWGFANGNDVEELNISAAATTLMIDPAEYDTRNDISHYTVDGQTLWSQAYTYCSGDRSSPIECDEGARFVEAVEQTLPEYLSDADGGSQTSATYQMQVCAIATNLFGEWIGDSSWLDHVVVNHLNASVKELTGYTLDGDNIEDMGYVQWATGAVSETLFSLKSLSMINQAGIWEFMDESQHMLGPELWAQVAIAGYPNMGNNMSVVAAKQLLDLLAEDSDKADNFRRFVMDQSTTYFGESDDWWEGSSSTARSFDGGDVLFIEQNPYADFSSTAWDESATEDYADLFSWLDETVMSSAAQCYALEDLYEECVDMVRSEGE